MTICSPQQCQREDAGVDLYSSPRVGSDEWVCRSIRPKDFGEKGKIKASFVSSRELQQGQLSAWRASTAMSFAGLAEKLKEKDWPHDNIVGVQALAIRASFDEGGRLFCVINDTRISVDGQHDAQHIAISPCQRLLNDGINEDLISKLKTELGLVFRSPASATLYAV